VGVLGKVRSEWQRYGSRRFLVLHSSYVLTIDEDAGSESGILADDLTRGQTPFTVA